MEKGFSIVNNEIIFESWKTGEISISAITKSFKLQIRDIALVSISPRIDFDDEFLLITIFDKDRIKYQFSDVELVKKAMPVLEENLNFKSPIHIEWQRFSIEDHESAMIDKILFPLDLYWNDLFVIPTNPKRFFIRFLKFFRIISLVSGKFHPKVKSYFNSKRMN